VRAATSVGEGAAQEELDLRVGAAQVVAGPPGQGIVDGRVQAEEDALAFGHGSFGLGSAY
jgi:hypothetical protein